jgi:hypothetical protein
LPPKTSSSGALAVEDDGRVDARERRGHERDRSAESEAPGTHVAGFDERLRVEPIPRRGHVVARLLFFDGGCRRFARDAALLRERQIKVGVGAVEIIDRERNVTEAGKQVGDAFELGIEAVQAFQHDHRGIDPVAAGPGDVRRHLPITDGY